MTRARTLIATALVAQVVFLCSGSPADALQIVEAKRAPSWYATETVSRDQTGKEMKSVVFGKSTVAFSPQDWDNILHAYGAEVVDAKKLPSWWGTEVVTKGSDGMEKRSVKFSTSPVGVTPKALDQVFAAYGLKVVDGKRLPAGYGNVVMSKAADGKDMTTTVLSNSTYATNPEHWNAVLSAYGH